MKSSRNLHAWIHEIDARAEHVHRLGGNATAYVDSLIVPHYLVRYGRRWLWRKIRTHGRFLSKLSTFDGVDDGLSFGMFENTLAARNALTI